MLIKATEFSTVIDKMKKEIIISSNKKGGENYENTIKKKRRIFICIWNDK